MKILFVTLIAVAGLCSLKLAGLSEKDQEFVREAAEAGMLEVKLGELAQKNGSDPTVKKLGQHMLKDHGKANEELKAIAKKHGVTPAAELSASSQKKYDELAVKTGANFDKAFSDCMVNDHKKVVDLFEKEAKNGDDADLKIFAAKYQPILEHHLHMSKETCELLKDKNR